MKRKIVDTKWKNIKEIRLTLDDDTKVRMALNKSLCAITQYEEVTETRTDNYNMRFIRHEELPTEVNITGQLKELVIPYTPKEKLNYWITLPFKKLLRR